MKLTRDLYEPYIDLSKGEKAATGSYDWGRVRKSTVFEFSANAQEETYGYIDTKTDTTEVTSYQPQLPLESVPESTDPIARFAQTYLFDFPLGSDTQVPFLLRYPLIDDEGNVDQAKVGAIIWDEAVMSNLALNTVDQKFTWTEMLNGTPRYGTMEKDSMEFIPNDTADASPEPAVFSTRARSSAKSDDE